VAAVAAGEEARHAARAGGMGGRGSLPPGRPAPPGTRRVLVHASGFTQSPYADVKPAGEDTRGARALATSQTVPDAVPGPGPIPGPDRSGRQGGDWAHGEAGDSKDDVSTLGMPPRKLWHASPGSSGH
jgi:error-prone DNA polymerase